MDMGCSKGICAISINVESFAFSNFKASVRAMSLPACAEVPGGRADAHIVSESDNTAAPAYLCPSSTKLLLSASQVASAFSRGWVH